MDKTDWQIIAILCVTCFFGTITMSINGLQSAIYYEDEILNCEQIEYIYEERFTSVIKEKYFECLKEIKKNG